jgi:hypothetical protein
VVAILVALPLGAVVLAGRWRDPPRERWGIPQAERDAAADTPELAEYRIRREHGLRDERRCTQVVRAVARGERAPADLRAAVVALAEVRVGQLEGQVARATPRRVVAFYAVFVVLAAAVVVAVVRGAGMALLYLVYLVGLGVTRNPHLLRRRLAAARAARAANAGAVGGVPPVAG